MIGISAVHVSKRFGGVTALDDCSVEIGAGEIVAIVGPNGAGKSTLFNVLSGLVPASSGSVTINGHRVTRRTSAHRVAHFGAVKTFQVPRGFDSLTVVENLMVAIPDRQAAALLRGMLGVGGRRVRARKKTDLALEMLDFLGLRHVGSATFRELSGGQKKLVDLGRALMVRPKMLMLDEPLAGVAPALAHGLVERLRVLRDQGIGIGLIEHRVEFIHEVCDRVYAIAQGRVIAAGKPVDVFKSQHVVDAFLGVEL